MAKKLTLAIIFLCLSYGIHTPETHTLSLPNSHIPGFLELSQDQTSTESVDSTETLTTEESTTENGSSETDVPDTAETAETTTEETSSDPEPSEEIVELTEDFAEEAPGEIVPDEEMMEEDQTPSQVTEPIEVEYEDYICICLPESENKTKYLDGDENGDEDEIIIEVMEEDETINNSGPPFDISPECSENFEINIDCVGPDCVIISDTSDQKTIEIVTTSSEGCLEDIGLIVTDSTVE
ncbi:hypothetical protein SteCoe_9793 [Stentor coeruleus]|uniref:Uncharacterized protein n=1 Tax=Stentor coeruleus TaxID=5963 RepID=A0A1R2CH58_9CILI|nr:hypothetical protein SteCoe_9793 [Stentor coeruleus]